MAIIRTPSQEPTSGSPTELTLTFNNGDYQALLRTVDRLGFRDEESMLRFVLAVLAQSATRSIKITDTSGKEVILNPSTALLQEDQTG